MFIVVIIAVIVLCLGVCNQAAARFSSAVRECKRIPSPENRTGGQMASEFLHSQGVEDVKVVLHEGVVSDYFDPKRRCLYLRRESLEGKDLAAWGIAMHEAAHALQTGEDKEALKWRRQCISMCRYLPTILFFVCIAVLVIMKMRFRFVMVGFSAACVGTLLMNMGTLAIEYNANERLRRWLNERLAKFPSAQEKLETMLAAVATRELGDLMSSPRYFFLSALPGSGKKRPT